MITLRAGSHHKKEILRLHSLRIKGVSEGPMVNAEHPSGTDGGGGDIDITEKGPTSKVRSGKGKDPSRQINPMGVRAV